MNDCKWIVNYDECALNHCICNGCMDCKNYEPKPEYTTEQIMASLKNGMITLKEDFKNEL